MILEVKNLRKQFSNCLAVANVSFKISTGEYLGRMVMCFVLK